MRLNLGGAKRTTSLLAEIERPLGESDLALLETELGVSPRPIARVRDSHHALARALAGGLRPMEASELTGFSPSRISILQRDPTFAELLEFYRDQARESFTDFVGRLKLLSLDAVHELQERLDSEPEKIRISDLLEIAKFGADRSGHGPQTKHLEANLTLTSEDFAQIKEVLGETHGDLIEQGSAGPLPTDRGALLGGPGEEPASEEPTARVEGERLSLRTPCGASAQEDAPRGKP